MNNVSIPQRNERNKPAQRAKFYSIIRSAHLERSNSSQDEWILYTRTNYDLDPALLDGSSRAVRVSPWRLPQFLRSNNIKVLEVNEPLMLPAWSVIIPIFLLRIVSPVMWSPFRVTFYAIENLDPSENLARQLHLPRSVARICTSLACQVAFRLANRVVFGTEGSMELYASKLGKYWKTAQLQSKIRLIDPLPSPIKGIADQKIAASVLFLGDLSKRKGITRLMDAWEKLPEGHRLSLSIIGVGEELARVAAWAEGKPEVHLLVNPARSVIHEALASAETLVLLSHTDARWREQIGLPLLEGWSYGCNLICTEATGIAALLKRAGHTVLPENFSDDMLVAALTGSSQSRRSAAEIQKYLPPVDGRLTADRWLNETFVLADESVTRNTK